MTSIAEYRTRGDDAPLDLVRQSADWAPVVRLINAWAKEKLVPSSGYSSGELDVWSRTHGVRFPPVLREWWRLAGRHPIVDPGLMSANASFVAPTDKYLVQRDLLIVTIDDVQTESGNGIHLDFLLQADPPVHGINTTIGPDDDPRLTWYKERFIETELRIPTLICATLMYHLFERSNLVIETADYLTAERTGLLGGQPDQKAIADLALHRFPNPTMVGDLYSDGIDIIYSWMMGFACRTAQAADHVRRKMSAQAR